MLVAQNEVCLQIGIRPMLDAKITRTLMTRSRGSSSGVSPSSILLSPHLPCQFVIIAHLASCTDMQARILISPPPHLDATLSQALYRIDLGINLSLYRSSGWPTARGTHDQCLIATAGWQVSIGGPRRRTSSRTPSLTPSRTPGDVIMSVLVRIRAARNAFDVELLMQTDCHDSQK